MDDFLFEIDNEVFVTRKNPNEIEKRYEAENAFLHTLSLGDYDGTIKNLEYFLGFKIEPRTTNRANNSRYLMVVLNTLCRKQLELFNRIHPLYLDDVSAKIATKLQELNDANEIDLFYKEIIRRYSLLVQNHSRKGYGEIVQNVVAYIDFHYYENLSLSYLANKFNLSPSYLSTLFKNEVGTTLTEYIHNSRIRQAILLLNSTSLTIREIAHACGYSDDNYFIRMFKKLQKISPKSYQQMIQGN